MSFSRIIFFNINININLKAEFTTSWGKHILRPVTPVPKQMTSELGANMSPEGLYDSHSSGTSEYGNSGDNTPTPTPTAVSASRMFFQNKVRVNVASQPSSPLNLPSHPKKYWGYSPYSGAQTSCSLHDNSMLSGGSKDGDLDLERDRERGRERCKEFAAKKAVFQSVLSPEKYHDNKIRAQAPGSHSADKGASVSKRFQEKVWEAMLIREKQQLEMRERDRLEIGSCSSDDVLIDSVTVRTKSVRDMVSNWSVSKESQDPLKGRGGPGTRDSVIVEPTATNTSEEGESRE